MVANLVPSIWIGQKYRTAAGNAEIVGTEKVGGRILYKVECDWHAPMLFSTKEILDLQKDGWVAIN